VLTKIVSGQISQERQEEEAKFSNMAGGFFGNEFKERKEKAKVAE